MLLDAEAFDHNGDERYIIMFLVPSSAYPFYIHCIKGENIFKQHKCDKIHFEFL